MLRNNIVYCALISSCTTEASDIPFKKVRVFDVESTDSLID